MKRIIGIVVFIVFVGGVAHAQVGSVVSDSVNPMSGLAPMRLQIDSLDNQLVEILARRMQVCLAVGEYKKQHGIAVVQNNRYKELVERLCKQGKDAGLSEKFVRKLMKLIHDESVRGQQSLMEKR